MNKYEITTNKKKKDIINAALSLFKDGGFTAVSVKEIAKLARVSQVSIYNYFGSKEALVAECANHIMKDTEDKAREILTKDISFIDKVKAALNICTESANRAISEHFSRNAQNDPVLYNLLIKGINENKRLIYRDYIELGKNSGAIPETLSAESILDFMDALNNMNPPPEQEDAIVHLFLYGIVGKS